MSIALPSRRAALDTDRVVLAVCFLVPLAALVLFFLYPLATIALRSVTEADGAIGLGNYARVIGAPIFWRAAWHSLVMSGAVTVLALSLGLVVAFALTRCAVPGHALIGAAVALPLIAPSLVQGLGLIFLLGRNGLVSKAIGVEIDIYGLPGLIIANGLYALPQAVLIIAAALRAADARVYEAAEVLGSTPWRAFRDITLPNIRFGLMSAGFVTFTSAITDFGNAATIGGDYALLATEVYNQAVGQMNFNLGAVVGITLLLPTVLALWLERVASQRQFGALAAEAVPLKPMWTPRRDLAVGLAAWAIALLPLLVIGVVGFASFVLLWPYRFDLTLRHYAVKVAGGYAPLWLTVEISVAAALAGTALAFALGLALLRAPRPLTKPIYLLCLLPASVPGLVLGLSYIFAFNRPGTPLALLYGTAALIAACNAAHYWTQGFLTIMTGLRQVPSALAETAQCLGATVLRTARDVVAPFMAPTLVSVFFFLFVQSMVTLSAVIFLVTASISVAAVSIMRLDEAGFVSQAAAYATCTMAVVIVALGLMRGLLWWIGKRQTLPA